MAMRATRKSAAGPIWPTDEGLRTASLNYTSPRMFGIHAVHVVGDIGARLKRVGGAWRAVIDRGQPIGHTPSVVASRSATPTDRKV